MLYTFLVGRPPFDTRGVKNTLNRVLSCAYEIPSNLSPEAADLIQSLLRRNPHERLKLREILEHPFLTKEKISVKKESSSVSLTIGAQFTIVYTIDIYSPGYCDICRFKVDLVIPNSCRVRLQL